MARWRSAGLERLGNEGVRASGFGAGKGSVIGIGGEEDDGNLVALEDETRGLYPIERALEVDVHQHEVRGRVLYTFEGVFSARDDAGDLISDALQHHGDVCGDDHFVLYDEDFNSTHASGGFCRI
jgi:hypothetical protein